MADIFLTRKPAAVPGLVSGAVLRRVGASALGLGMIAFALFFLQFVSG